MFRLMLFLVLILVSLSDASADNILTYDFADKNGDEVFVSPNTSDENLVGFNFVRGNGLSPAFGGETFSSSGWNTLAQDDYLSFGFSVADGFSAQLDQLQFRSLSEAGGPRDLALFTSLDGFKDSVATLDHESSRLIQWTLDLTDVEPISESVEFRLYATSDRTRGGGPLTEDGVFRIGNFIEGRDIQLFQLSGNVTAVPESGTLILLVVVFISLVSGKALRPF